MVMMRYEGEEPLDCVVSVEVAVENLWNPGGNVIANQNVWHFEGL